jgi:lysine N6-hydroxylase
MKSSIQETYDLVGIGIGPFNLGLAAMLGRAPEISAMFFEQKPAFDWHPGLLLDEVTIQVPFLADLVSMADPASPFSYLHYLHRQGRLYRFYFLERFHIPRREYNHYCQWVAGQLPSCRFGRRVESVTHLQGEQCFEVTVRDVVSGVLSRCRARNLVLGVGTEPSVPTCFARHCGDTMFHAGEFLFRRDQCRRSADITVIGSGQSGAEVFHHLLKEQGHYGYRLSWFTRSDGFFPMEYSKLGLEHFSPDYAQYFFRLSQARRRRVLAGQALLYKGISVKTIDYIYDLLYERSIGGATPEVRLLALVEVEDVVQMDHNGEPGYRLICRHRDQNITFSHDSRSVVLATGYRALVPPAVHDLRDLIQWDEEGRYQIEEDYRLCLTQPLANRIFVQNAEMHTHGVGAPDLGLGAHRNAVIINTVAERQVHHVRDHNVFQQFGVK